MDVGFRIVAGAAALRCLEAAYPFFLFPELGMPFGHRSIAGAAIFGWLEAASRRGLVCYTCIELCALIAARWLLIKPEAWWMTGWLAEWRATPVFAAARPADFDDAEAALEEAGLLWSPAEAAAAGLLPLVVFAGVPIGVAFLGLVQGTGSGVALAGWWAEAPEWAAWALVAGVLAAGLARYMSAHFERLCTGVPGGQAGRQRRYKF